MKINKDHRIIYVRKKTRFKEGLSWANNGRAGQENHNKNNLEAENLIMERKVDFSRAVWRYQAFRLLNAAGEKSKSALG